MTAATPGQAERFALSERLVEAAGEIKRCRSVTVTCHACESQIDDVMAAADFYAQAIAAQDARPAPGDEFARVKVRLCALVDSLDKTAGHDGAHAEEFDQGAAHASAVTARQLRAILDETALGAAPEPQDARPGPDVCECGHYWAHHAFSDDVCAVVGCPCTRPRPAPRPAPGYVTVSARDIAIALNGYAGFTGDPVSFASELHERLRRTVFADGTHQPQPAPELADAMAESRYREALENVFAVLDRQTRTYAERISYARTLIRTALEGK